MHFHAVVWMDHRNAHVLGFGEGKPSCNLVKSEGADRIHHKAGSIGSGHSHDAPAYFAAVADALSDYREILIAGPAETKTEFHTYLVKYRPNLVKRVLGVEAMDHASEKQIIDRARRFFVSADRMTPQIDRNQGGKGRAQ